MIDARIGQQLGKYKITEKIGRGGMAEVYKAYQANLDRHVAIKIMHAHLVGDASFLGRFKREARTMAAFNHPHIVRIYDFDTFGPNSHYLVMDYIEGESLKEHLEQLVADGRRMSLERSIKITAQVADALAYAHHRGMIHRDVKPANIMLDADGEPYLTDFGIAKMIAGQTMGYTATGALIGTPTYMSPEQALGKPGDKRSDIYSLGIMIFEMATGKLPFDADTPIAVAMKHVHDQVPLPVSFNPDVPQSLQTVILRALAKAPADRFQTADEMAAALRRIDLSRPELAATAAAASPASRPVPPTIVAPRPAPAYGPPAPIVSPSPPPPTPQRKKRRWPWVLAVAFIILLRAGGAAAFFWPQLGLPPLPGFSGPTPVTVATTTPTLTPLPTTAVPTDTPTPADTPDTVATILVAAAQTATAQAPTAVPGETAAPTAAASATPTTTPTASTTASPTTTATPTQISNGSGSAYTGDGLPLRFESFGTWVRGDEDNGTFTQSSTRVHGGSRAARLSYDFGSSGNDYVVFLQLNSISGAPNALQIWVYGDGSGQYLNAWIVDKNGETWQVPLGRITHSGWQQMTGYIATGQAWPWGHISGPSNNSVDYPITFRGFVLDDYANSYTGQGTIYLDDLTATTANVGSIPTALPVTSTASTPVPTSVVNPGDAGRILYTSGDALLTTDPDWASPKELGTIASDTCNSPASTVAGQTYNLHYGYYCNIGATGTSLCAAPNSQYEVLVNHVSGSYSIVVRPAGTEDLRFVYQGALNLSEGIRWSPASDSFLFVVDNSVNRAFLGGAYNAVIPTAFTPIFSPDGSLILYRKPVGPGVHDIFVSNADGSNQHNVTNVPAIDKKCAAWRS